MYKVSILQFSNLKKGDCQIFKQKCRARGGWGRSPLRAPHWTRHWANMWWLHCLLHKACNREVWFWDTRLQRWLKEWPNLNSHSGIAQAPPLLWWLHKGPPAIAGGHGSWPRGLRPLPALGSLCRAEAPGLWGGKVHFALTLLNVSQERSQMLSALPCCVFS